MNSQSVGVADREPAPGRRAGGRAVEHDRDADDDGSRSARGAVPTFVQGRPLTRAALDFAARAHEGSTRDGDGAPFILHPLDVASLLSSCDCPDELTAAAVLHDTLEDTAATADELRAQFGEAVARLVRCLTENERIADEGARKSALRGQVEDADSGVARIYAADKLSKVRELRIRLHAEPAFAGRAAGQRKLEHYWRSLAMLERTISDDPLVRQLRFELEAVRDLPPRNTSRDALAHAMPEPVGLPPAPDARLR